MLTILRVCAERLFQRGTRFSARNAGFSERGFQRGARVSARNAGCSHVGSKSVPHLEITDQVAVLITWL